MGEDFVVSIEHCDWSVVTYLSPVVFLVYGA